ncbi:hypothetical protein GCM10009836_57840 [Pseudonocardia ailaonensis]|uniref:Uncharacterized protein n=1 Tax=Pseudonocardia ailaonensis TaxID=367279 RepID=A0ABN2NIR4_9PSEU
MSKAGGCADDPREGEGRSLDARAEPGVTRSTHAVSTIEENTTATAGNATTAGRDGGCTSAGNAGSTARHGPDARWPDDAQVRDLSEAGPLRYRDPRPLCVTADGEMCRGTTRHGP